MGVKMVNFVICNLQSNYSVCNTNVHIQCCNKNDSRFSSCWQ